MLKAHKPGRVSRTAGVKRKAWQPDGEATLVSVRLKALEGSFDHFFFVDCRFRCRSLANARAKCRVKIDVFHRRRFRCRRSFALSSLRFFRSKGLVADQGHA